MMTLQMQSNVVGESNQSLERAVNDLIRAGLARKEQEERPKIP